MGAYILGGGLFAGGSAAPTYPTTDLIQANPYPNLGTLPTWTATVGGDGTAGINVVDTGTGFQLDTSANSIYWITFSSFGPTAYKPFTFVRVYKYAAGLQYYTQNTANTSYFATTSGSCFILSSSYPVLVGSPPSSPATSGYIVERIRRNTAGDIYYQTTGRAEVLVFAGLPESLFPLDTIKGNNFIGILSQFLYSGDNGDLTESGKWSQLASWISTNNFGASL